MKYILKLTLTEYYCLRDVLQNERRTLIDLTEEYEPEFKIIDNIYKKLLSSREEE